MTKIISIATNKGGVGKTTSAAYLATALSEHGKVLALDLDSTQGSLTLWAQLATDASDPLPFDVVPVAESELHAPSRKTFTGPELANRFPGYDFIVVDTPPTNIAIIEAAVTFSDLIVVPLKPGPMEVDRLWAMLDATQGVPTVALLLGTKDTATTRDTQAALQEEADNPESTFLKFDREIRERQSIVKAHGSTPKDLEGYGHIAAEALEILNAK